MHVWCCSGQAIALFYRRLRLQLLGLWLLLLLLLWRRLLGAIQRPALCLCCFC
jgi:hypothetical protein